PNLDLCPASEGLPVEHGLLVPNGEADLHPYNLATNPKDARYIVGPAAGGVGIATLPYDRLAHSRGLPTWPALGWAARVVSSVADRSCPPSGDHDEVWNAGEDLVFGAFDLVGSKLGFNELNNVAARSDRLVHVGRQRTM